MKYFTHHHDLGGSERLEIQVRYRKDQGISWYHGQPYKRGLLVDFTPVTIEERNGYLSKTFKVGDGRGRILFIEELKRQSDKKGRALAAFVETHIDLIAAAAAQQDWNTVVAILRDHHA